MQNFYMECELFFVLSSLLALSWRYCIIFIAFFFIVLHLDIFSICAACAASFTQRSLEECFDNNDAEPRQTEEVAFWIEWLVR